MLRATHSSKRLGDISRSRGRRYTAESGQRGFGYPGGALAAARSERVWEPCQVRSLSERHKHPGTGLVHQSAPDGPSGSTCGRIHCETYRAINEPACARPRALTLANARGTSEAKRVGARSGRVARRTRLPISSPSCRCAPRVSRHALTVSSERTKSPGVSRG